MVRQTNESQNGFAALTLEWLRRVFRTGFAGMGRARGERRMELIETLPLGGKRQLMLVLCDGQRVLVGASGDGVHSIAEMKDPTVGGFAAAISGGLHGYEPVAIPGCEEREVRCS